MPLRILDVGCGVKKRAGSIGIDRNRNTAADVIGDLDHFPYPFADASFDELYAIHVIEHVSDVIRTMEEFHRLVRKGGLIRSTATTGWLRRWWPSTHSGQVFQLIPLTAPLHAST